MLVPKVDLKEFEKFGFRLCKGEAGKNGCYYLCVSRGCKMLFVSPILFGEQDWRDDDPRIHERPNCRYRSYIEPIDIIYQLIKADMLKEGWEE